MSSTPDNPIRSRLKAILLASARSRVLVLVVALTVFAGAVVVAERLRQSTDAVTQCMATDTRNVCYEGLTEAAATARATNLGQVARVIERDGEPLPATMDLRQDRLNFVVEDGKIIRVTNG